MNLSRNQIIILSTVGVLVLILLLVLIGILPGLKKKTTQVRANLQFWGVADPPSAYEGAVAAFTGANPGVEISYRNFPSEEDYETALLNALAAGKGPDVFMVRNMNVLRDMDKISPAPAAKLSILGLRNLFPQIVESDFAPDGLNIYGLPLSIDTLAMIYNEDAFNRAAIVSPPKTWAEFEEIVPKLARVENGKIKKAAAALGGSRETIENAADILSLLMLQSGTEMISKDLTAAAFASSDGEEAMNFYLKFSDPENNLYTWSGETKKAREAFVSGEVAVIFDYAGTLRNTKAGGGALLKAVAAEMPQPAGAASAISFGNYRGYTVSRQSRYANLAWDFVLNLTTNAEVATGYINATGRPPALRSLINQTLNDPNLSVFAKQAITARAWPQVDYNKTSGILSEAIEAVLVGQASVRSALQTAEDEVTELLVKRL